MKKFHKYIFFLILFFQYFVSNSQSTVYQIDITKEIGSTTWRYLRAGLHQAQEQNAKAVILRLNTYGGTVVHADSMRTAILNAPIPVYAFVDNNAASAGALIAIACDSIYMRSSASMGAATESMKPEPPCPTNTSHTCGRPCGRRPSHTEKTNRETGGAIRS